MVLGLILGTITAGIMGSKASQGGHQTPYQRLELGKPPSLEKYKMTGKRRVGLGKNTRTARIFGMRESYENDREEAENELRRDDRVSYAKMQRGLKLAGLW